MKKNRPVALRLHRETLLRLEANASERSKELLAAVRGQGSHDLTCPDNPSASELIYC